MTIDQWEAKVEVLREPDQCIIDWRISVGVQLPHHLADDPLRLHVSVTGRQPHLLHLVDNASLNWFQAVSRIR